MMTQATRTSMWSALPAPPDSWNTIPGQFAASTTYLNHAAILLHNGQVLVAGGSGFPDGRQRVPGQGIKLTQRFDPNSNTWNKAADLNFVHASDPTGTLLFNETVLLVGNTQQAEIYDPSADTWTPTTPMNALRSEHTATLLSDGRVLAAGGVSNAGTTAELFDPNAGTWTSTNPMTAARANHAATRLSNGQVLVAGGDATGPTAELFDPTTGKWTATGPMMATRLHHTATLLSNGYVLVAGGGNPGSEIGSAELYLPISNAWMPVTPMNIPRTNHTATLLYDNRVLIVGGSGSIMTIAGDNDILRTVPGDTMLLTPDGKTISTAVTTSSGGTKGTSSAPKAVSAGSSEEYYTPSQYQGQQADLAALNGLVKQLNNTISSLNQTLSQTQQLANAAMAAASAASTANKPSSTVKWGIIDTNGSILAGSGGFTVAAYRAAPNQYTVPTPYLTYEITFQPAFSSPPAVVATTNINLVWSASLMPAVAIPVVNSLAPDRCRIVVSGMSASGGGIVPADLPICFVAYGPS